jgi:hypothetical protein
MTAREQTEQFSGELERFIERTRLEYELTHADIIAVLGLTLFELAQEMQTLNEIEGDEATEE